MSVLDEVRDLAEAVTRRRSLSLWDIELAGQPGRSIVRVFVHGDQGVDLDTVAEISEELSRGLDLKDPIAGRYTLEVSSPGLERNLRTPEHFVRSIGDQVVVKTTEIVNGNSHRIEGTVVDATESAVRIKASDEDALDVPYSLIKSAKTVFEWN